MRFAFAGRVASTVSMVLLIATVCFSQAPADPPRKVTLDDAKGALLTEGRPDCLRQTRFLADSSSFRYAMFADSPSDTLLFVVKQTANVKPRYWLLSIRSGILEGTCELNFDTSSSGVMEIEGTLLRSEQAPLKFDVRYSSAEQRVWCRTGSHLNGGHSGPSDFLLGVRFEPSFIIGSYLGLGIHSSNTDFEPAFSFVPMYKVFRSLLLVGQVGMSPGSGYDSFGGMEFGLYVRYTFLQDRFYILAGYANYQEPGNGHNFVDIPDGSYDFLSLGGGIQLGANAMLDVSVLLPSKRTFGTEWSYPSSQSSHPKTVDAILKIGVCLYTDFSSSDEETP